jgi:hypothetical protein
MSSQFKYISEQVYTCYGLDHPFWNVVFSNPKINYQIIAIIVNTLYFCYIFSLIALAIFIVDAFPPRSGVNALPSINTSFNALSTLFAASYSFK